MWGRPQYFHLLLGFALLGCTACATPKVYLIDHYVSPRRVAVLPVSNETTDLDGPPFIRQLIFENLSGRGYDLAPMADIDAKLLEQGFTDGGQLNAASPQKLGEWVAADGLFYTTLVSFNYINLGYYWQRKVTVYGRLVDAQNGDKLWEAERTWMTLNVVTKQEQAKREFAIQLATKAVEKTTHKPLQAESRIAVRRLLDTLPRH